MCVSLQFSSFVLLLLNVILDHCEDWQDVEYIIDKLISQENGDGGEIRGIIVMYMMPIWDLLNKKWRVCLSIRCAHVIMQSRHK